MGSDHHHHIVMLPFMAHGHLIPFLELAKQIKHRASSFTVTIATTSRNIQYLRSTISASNSSASSEINFADLPFDSSHHGLPPNTENTENVPPNKLGDFLHSSTSLEAPFRKLIADITGKEGRPPVCIISDVFFGWATTIAESLGTINISFTTGGAYGTAAYVSLWLNLPHFHTGADEFTLLGFPERCRFHRTQLHPYVRAANGTDQWSRFMQPQISLSLKSSGWLANTVIEMEPFGMEILQNFINLPLWPIGPLLPVPALKSSSGNSTINSAQRTGKVLGISTERCLQWLNLQKPNSVIYISFGSQNTIGKTQMMELATGLGKSGRPFIWVIRPPLGFDIKGEFRAEWLPLGFEERVTERKLGLIVRNWAPQLEILGHESTGLFLSHCGWNSVMESLSQGVPIMGWPMAAEQAYNSKMLEEEMGVSVELSRGVQSAIVGEKVKEMIEMVMDENVVKGMELRKRAGEVREKMRAAVRDEGGHQEVGSSVKAMDDFLGFVLANGRSET
ncbi:hypothetical protein FNV43_RR02049 [Rhamnella rubrinervis]|uniref:Glycosyltransferase n=1 Tax=Rhamnella rubrinervis TaxID=2594499 RepID=A0A8K0HQZ4_9ROSA|nr:hypothetical protein FNV43_RR02049 [Rhamnella rubrinervis]